MAQRWEWRKDKKPENGDPGVTEGVPSGVQGLRPQWGDVAPWSWRLFFSKSKVWKPPFPGILSCFSHSQNTLYWAIRLSSRGTNPPLFYRSHLKAVQLFQTTHHICQRQSKYQGTQSPNKSALPLSCPVSNLPYCDHRWQDCSGSWRSSRPCPCGCRHAGCSCGAHRGEACGRHWGCCHHSPERRWVERGCCKVWCGCWRASCCSSSPHGNCPAWQHHHCTMTACTSTSLSWPTVVMLALNLRDYDDFNHRHTTAQDFFKEKKKKKIRKFLRGIMWSTGISPLAPLKRNSQTYWVAKTSSLVSSAD